MNQNMAQQIGGQQQFYQPPGLNATHQMGSQQPNSQHHRGNMQQVATPQANLQHLAQPPEPVSQ